MTQARREYYLKNNPDRLPHIEFAEDNGFREYCLQIDQWLCGECGAVIGEADNCRKHFEWHRRLEVKPCS